MIEAQGRELITAASLILQHRAKKVKDRTEKLATAYPKLSPEERKLIDQLMAKAAETGKAEETEKDEEAEENEEDETD